MIAAADGTLRARLAELMEAHSLEMLVVTDAGDALADFADLAPRVLATSVRPERVAEARARVAARGHAHARVVQGHAPRVLADLRAQIPERTLWLLGASTARDAIFQVPRGQGVIACEIAPQHGVAGYASVQDQLLRWSPDHSVEICTAADGTALLIARPSPRIHVTFLIEKYTAEYGASGISINLDNLVATLEQTGLATWNVVHYDECFHEGRAIPIESIRKPAGVDRHVLVCTCHYHSRANPAPDLLREAQASGSRIAFMWLDKKISQSTPEYYRVADVNVVLDGNDFDLPNAWPIFTPKNPIWFCDPGLPRTIPVSLVGEVRYLSQRKAYQRRLAAERRIPVQLFHTSAADTGRALTVAEYARLYQTSKISLALTKDAVRQLKGRVFEILHCGALLMCDRNHHVSHYLVPGEDYVAFDDYEDLVAKCAHYLAHDHERFAIARAGHRKAKRYYGHDVFWRSLLARLGACAGAASGGGGAT